MPSIGKYTCSTCEFVANNRRMLARHVAVVHSQKTYRCPMCPFITRYAANWYRHKRGIHGITKLSTCEVCGFFANSTQDLVHHKETEHPDNLSLLRARDKYARENEIATNTNSSALIGQPPVVNSVFNFQAAADGENYEDFDVSNDNYDPTDFLEVVSADDSVTFSLPVNGGIVDNDNKGADIEVTSAANSSGSPTSMAFVNNHNLSPLKVRRSYCCDICGLLTSNPREFLYHQRDIHHMRINVHECSHCIYASKHIQKLQRHFNLVHKNKVNQQSPRTVPKTPPSRAKRVQNRSTFQSRANINPEFMLQEAPIMDMNSGDLGLFSANDKLKRGILLKCAACNYQTKNKFLLLHHEKTVHSKKKFFRCSQCGYVTNEKGRYTKHMKHHDLPKIQCEFCHFKSAYKWSMDRHKKNHGIGGDGKYNCTLCNFICASQHSLKLHVANHHPLPLPPHPEDYMEMNMSMPAVANGHGTNPNNVKQPEFIWTDGFEEFQSPSTHPSSSTALLGQTSQMQTTSMEWNNEQQILQCNSCHFQTAWPYELKRHEEIHKNTKKHACPLCGMGFEHIAWLTKHLYRVHKENAEAERIAAAYEQLKPQRYRPARSMMTQRSPQLPNYEAAMAKPQFMASKSAEPKQSVLSTLLKGNLPKYPLQAQRNMNEFQLPPSTEMLEEPPVETLDLPTPKAKPVKVDPCGECGYKTKWISEMEKHMRVHSDDKPFRCTKCAYHSKWKGDLTRHLLKHHGIKVPIVHRRVSAFKKRRRILVKKSFPVVKRRAIVQKGRTASSAERANVKSQDSPLDLTVGKNDGFSTPLYKLINFSENEAANLEAEMNSPTFRSEVLHSTPKSSYLNMLLSSNVKRASDRSTASPVSGDTSKRKYYCPFCSFNTSTASRFHVHIVQHYNKRPFMCSSCGYRSNWEWDITKHIRLRGCKDAQHNNACVLLTDETGRRNYDKYDKYLRGEKNVGSAKQLSKSTVQANSKKAKNNLGSENSSTSDVAFGETPETIVVTPDLPFAQEADKSDVDELSNIDLVDADNLESPNANFKFFMCKHCNFKHSSKKGVVSHLSVHAGVRPFRCRVCGLTSNWRHIVVNHVKVIHNGYMNDVEERIAYTQEGFVIRITSVLNEDQLRESHSSSAVSNFNCKFCPYKCEKEVYIKFHMKQHKPREGAVYQCTYCPYYVKFKKTLMRHLKLHEPQPIQEAVNASIGGSDTDLNEFVAQDGGYANGENEPYEMDDDTIRITFDQLNAPDISFYESSPTKKNQCKFKRHVCEQCPYRTNNRTQFLYHKQFHRPNSSAPFRCSFCTYWASMQHLLTQHMKIHLQEPPVIMEMSEELETEFLTLDSIQQKEQQLGNAKTDLDQIPIVLVQRGGTTEKMFRCRFCPMMNKKRANVRVHERMHNKDMGEGKYTCSLCNYKCMGQGGLTNHMKIHQSNKGDVIGTKKASTAINNASAVAKRKVFSYFCMKCPAVFKSSSDLYIHKTFHGSNLPFPCTTCDYRAKHKIHLQKHLQVHTEAYVSKRDASFGPPVNPALDNPTESVALSKEQTSNAKKMDQLLLLEKAEVNTCLRNKGVRTGKHQCTFCPASFAKPQVHAYHLTLHGCSAEFGCSQCNYATSRSENLSVHEKLHTPAPITKKTPCRFKCPSCPYETDKLSRSKIHQSKHGRNHRFRCEKCDYSVRFLTNLRKHMVVHQKDSVGEDENKSINAEDKNNNLADSEPSKSETQRKSQDNNRISNPANENKKMYVCDRCPYSQVRKDAVQSHQQRHYQKEGSECPYCDYKVNGPSFLRDHIKSHMQPTNIFVPQQFMRYEEFEIWCDDGENNTLLFQDKGVDINSCNRFFPAIGNEQDLKTLNADEKELKPSKSELSEGDSKENINPSNDGQQTMLPRVVLTDILSGTPTSKKSSKKKHSGKKSHMSSADPAKSKKQCKLSNDESPMCKNSPKSSIIVKIKVEKNILEGNSAESLYTIATDQPGKSEPTSDAASDVTIPNDDIGDFSADNIENETANQLSDDANADDGSDMPIEEQKDQSQPTTSGKPKKPVFACSKCPYTTYRHLRFRIHSNLHGKKFRFQCDKCDYAAHFSRVLHKHKIIHNRCTNDNPISSTDMEIDQSSTDVESCTPDNVTVEAEKNSNAAPKEQHAVENGIEESTGSEENVNTESASEVTSKSEEKCTVESNSSQSNNVNKPHPPVVTKKFKCQKCPYQSDSRSHSQYHESKHGKNFEFKCEKCDYSTEYLEVLNRHKVLHQDALNMDEGVSCKDSIEPICTDADTSPRDVTMKEAASVVDSSAAKDKNSICNIDLRSKTMEIVSQF